MRHLTKRTVGGLTLGCLMAYSFLPTPGLARPSQKITPVSTRPAAETGLPAHSEPVRPNHNSTLARNTSAKPESAVAPATTSPKTTTAASKGTIGRCWKRLMNMVREANHVHRNKDK